MRPVGGRRYLAWMGAVAAVGLVVPLVGCGTTGDQAEAAGGKAGGSVPAEPVVLRMLNPVSEADSQDFVSAVDRVSGGSLRIDVVDQWHQDAPNSITREHELIDAIRAGEAPLALTAVRAWHDQGVRSFDALIAPMLIDRAELLPAVLHSEIPAEMLAGLEGSGLTGVGILPGPMRHPGGVTGHFLDVSDYRGADFLVTPGAIGRRWLETLGASPIASMFGAVPNPADADGFEIQISSGPADAAKSITTNVTFGPRPVVIYGNTAAMAGLSEQHRKFLSDAAIATIDIKFGNDQNREKEDAGVLCRSGSITFEEAITEHVDALHTKAELMYRWLREDAATEGFMDRIQHLSDATPVDPATSMALDCAASPSASASAQGTAASLSPGPIDGTYTASTTLDDLKSTGVPAEALIPENYGESVYVYDRGRFATTSQNDEACVWAYGRYTVDGGVLMWDFEGGGGQSPNGATNKPGEQFGFNWSMYRDVLTLTNKEGMISPMADGNLWEFQRISTTPDPAALSQQCPPPAEAFPH